LIEVLSKSTEAYDRGFKFEQYRKLSSLKQYVLISQEKAHIEVFSRNEEDQWVLTEATGLSDEIGLASIQGKLALSAVYENVELDAVA
jgi:Uma2 family endonuclease